MGFFIPGVFVSSDDMRKVQDQQAVIIGLLNQLVKGSVTTMATIKDIQANIAGLQADVTAEKNAEDAIVLLLNKLNANDAALQAQLAAAIAASDPVAIQAAMDALTANRAAVQANTAALAAAVLANTPAATP